MLEFVALFGAFVAGGAVGYWLSHRNIAAKVEAKVKERVKELSDKITE